MKPYMKIDKEQKIHRAVYESLMATDLFSTNGEHDGWRNYRFLYENQFTFRLMFKNDSRFYFINDVNYNGNIVRQWQVRSFGSVYKAISLDQILDAVIEEQQMKMIFHLDVLRKATRCIDGK